MRKILVLRNSQNRTLLEVSIDDPQAGEKIAAELPVTGGAIVSLEEREVVVS